MTGNENLIYIPKDANYIEILGYRIDGFNSFEAFCEHLKKYAELEETVERQQAEIKKLKGIEREYLDEIEQTVVKKLKLEFYKSLIDFATSQVIDFAEGLKDIYRNDKRYDRPNAHTMIEKLFDNIDKLLEEKLGE